MKEYLLDTNICIFAMRDKHGINDRLESINPQQCYVTDVTADTIDAFCQEKVRLQSLGTPIEDYDLFIGCAAKVAGLTMVTDNVQHLGRIEGLEIENWVER
jgi:tRNA(fMet)-specific endonuclease VapC